MGQREVFDWLRNKRESGDDRYFLPKEIEMGLKAQGFSNGICEHLRGDCFRLWQRGNGCLEMYDFDTKGRTNWLKAFRVKAEYCRNKDSISKGDSK